jgi:SAM-dependent methyltransferase
MSMSDRHPFGDVDGQAAPQAWVAVLDRLSAEPLYQPYKRRLIELLEPDPESSYLDVGCGTGAAALALKEACGCRVTGLDSSKTMTHEAGARGLTTVVLADAHALPFAGGAFDGAWGDRTFQHLADPRAALHEMVRVVKPGGVVLTADPDYSTQHLSISDADLADRVLQFRATYGIRNGELAHRMNDLFTDVGLDHVTSEEWPIVVRDPNSLDHVLGLRDWARFAAEQGLIDHAEIPRWEQELATAVSDGTFLYSFSNFITRGVKSPD